MKRTFELKLVCDNDETQNPMLVVNATMDPPYENDMPSFVYKIGEYMTDALGFFLTQMQAIPIGPDGQPLHIPEAPVQENKEPEKKSEVENLLSKNDFLVLGPRKSKIIH